MKWLLTSVAAAAALAVGPASAADIPVKAPRAPAVAYSWTGCYLGIQGGYVWGRSQHKDSVGTPITNYFDVDGGLFGGTAGCQVQTAQSWVFGMEADGAWSGKGGQAVDIPPFNTDFISVTKEKWLATVRTRTGWAMGQTLFYVTSGAAFAGVEIHVFNSTNPASAATEERTRAGLIGGGGVEWAFAPNFSVKAEYLYVRFSRGPYFNSTITCCSARGDVKLDDHIARVGLNWRLPVGGGMR